MVEIKATPENAAAIRALNTKLEQARLLLLDAENHENFYRASLNASVRDAEGYKRQIARLERELLAAMSRVPAASLIVLTDPIIPNN